MTSTRQSASTLSDAQRAALAARLRRGRQPGSAPIPRRDPSAPTPLSFGQEQLWFLDQLAPGRSTYNVAGGLRLNGELDVEALRGAVRAVVDRHESLRTRLVTGPDGIAQQVIDPPGAQHTDFVDLTGSGEPAAPDGSGDAESRLRAWCMRAAEEPFDLARGPLFRTTLLRVRPDEHVLLFVVHHTVFDGWSFGVLRAELTELYQANRQDREAQLTELPVQYADYAVWERSLQRVEALAELADYWRDTLEDLETVQLSTDRPRPVLQDFTGKITRRRIGGAETTRGLADLARTQHTTMFAALLATVNVLIHRYTGQDDLIIGTASANRGRAELASMIGYLVNTLPIRVDASGDPTFVEFLQRVNETVVAAYQHQDLPFAQVVEALQVDRDASRSPIFQIGFTQANEDPPIHAGGLTISPELVEMVPAKFDLNFFAFIEPAQLTMDISYATALFDEPTVQRMLGHLEVLLSSIVADPQRRLSQLDLLTEIELEHELRSWNDTGAEFPAQTLHEAFEQQVARTPEGLAIDAGAAQLSYAQLNDQANRIAGRLAHLGTRPETLVGVCMGPSAQRIAAVLGVLKAGGGYVPLDPELPPDRLAFMAQDAELAVIIVDEAGRAALPAGDTPVLDIAADWGAIMTGPVVPVPERSQLGNVAYVIYTSGSTGEPKGVVLEHRHAMNFLHGMIRHFPMHPGHRVLQFASLSFDVSVMDIFMPLCSGATLVVAGRDTLLSPPRLADLLRERAVTFVCLPPAVVNLLSGQSFPDLQILLSAGEELSAELVRAWVRPGLRFYNGYGPTEAAIGATFTEVDGTVSPPPIGRPKPNYQVYVLDAQLNPLPVGAVGELHIGGAGVARGYHRRPELTAQRFVSDPFRPGGRLYKTGDLVRRRSDGAIQFIGRIDGQVKLHGLRIELGEIESALVSHPEVAQAVVTVYEDAAGDKQLVGYARAEHAGSITPAALRQHLAQRLPGYMIPTQLLVLAQFPLTHNGKIDKAALPAPQATERTQAAEPAETLLEMMLLDAYAGVLKQDDLGVADSFFDVGGNSLQAMQLVTRVRSDLAVDFDVATIFLAPSPRELAAVLRDEHGLQDAPLEEVPLESLEGLGKDDAAALFATD